MAMIKRATSWPPWIPGNGRSYEVNFAAFNRISTDISTMMKSVYQYAEQAGDKEHGVTATYALREP